MFVVRVENDEAAVYRAFRHMQTARAWAVERNREDVECFVDIFETPGDGDDPRAAVVAAQRGASRTSLRAEVLTVSPSMMPAASDICFGRAAVINA